MEVVEMKNELVIDTETTNKNPHKAKLLGISLSDGNKSSYYNDALFYNKENKCDFIAHNGKYDAVVLHNVGIDIEVKWDTMLAYYLLHIDKRRKLEVMMKDIFNEDKKDLLQIYNECSGKDRKKLPDEWWLEVPEETLAIYAQEDVKGTYKLYKKLSAELKERPELEAWFYEIEMPLLNILVKSELTGVKIDVDKMYILTKKCRIRRESLLNNMRVMADDEGLNVNSSKQLQEVLFVKFKLPRSIKTKTGWSTGAKVLDKLKSKSGFVRNLLEYKKLEKLLNSFLTMLPNEVDSDSRLHATFNQALTRTRRFSCNDPNLQQIPSKGELAQELRSCFIPKEGYKFLVADYSQIELRLLAHFSKEPALISAYQNGGDVHEQTASFIANKLGTEFTRDQGKLLNFSIVYGKSAYGFSNDWGCSQKLASEILEAYFTLYPGVKRYIEEQKLIGRNARGWIKSIAGLPLFVDKVNSLNKWEYEEAGRQIVNYRIQGSSQDIMKKAIVNIYQGYNIYPLLMIHDELVYEVPDKKIYSPPVAVIMEMEQAWKLDVPLEVSYKITDHWEK